MPTLSDLVSSVNASPSSAPPTGDLQQPAPVGLSNLVSHMNGEGESSPVSGIQHDESDRFTPEEDPGDNWLQKVGYQANKPLTESLFGWGLYRQGAGGLERGVEKTLSGLTAPLSLGLLAAFAPAGIAEGVAGSALKEGLTEGGTLLGTEALDGFTASSKVESYIKAVDAAKKAQIAGIPGGIEAAAKANGLEYQEFLNYGQYLRNQGLQEADVLPESFARRAASQGLRKAGVGPGQAIRIAKGAETLVNAGFGVQQLHGAIYAYPRMLDLMSQGDYDGAAEYLVEGTTGTIFGGLGVAHGLYSISDIVPGVNEKNQLALSDESENIKKVFGRMDGDLAATQAQISARKRLRIIGIMDAAGIDIPAGLRERLPFTEGEQARFDELKAKSPEDLTQDEAKQLSTYQERDLNNQKTGLGAELVSAWNNILASKADREKLLQKQKDIFAAMDSGNDRVLMHQKLMSLTAGTHQEDFVRDVLKYEFLPPERTIEDIANEEKNSILAVKAAAGENRQKISDLTTELNIANNDLKKATPETLQGLQQRIEQTRNAINEAQLRQEDLDKKYSEAKDWEDPDKQEAAFYRLYKSHIQVLKEAYDSTPLNSPDAREIFNEKVRALGNWQKDLDLIEDKYPHFRNPEEGNFSPEARNDPSLTRYFNQEKSYSETLEDPELLEVASTIYTPAGPMLAVPLGGNRVSGSLDYTFSEEERPEAEAAVKELEEHNNTPSEISGRTHNLFPNPRIVKTGLDSLVVQWGETPKEAGAEITRQAAVDRLAHEILNYQSNEEYYKARVRQNNNARDRFENLIRELEDQLSESEGPLTEDEKRAIKSNIEFNQRLLGDTNEHLKEDIRLLDEAEKETADKIKEHENIVSGKTHLTPTAQDRAAAYGKQYGYKPEAVRDYLDANKNYFTGPDIAAAKEQTKLPTFKKWFRNSKVVDENGDPLVVFHGTRHDWEVFDPKTAFRGNSIGLHAGSISQAWVFADSAMGLGARAKIMPLFLSIQNPLRLPDLGSWFPTGVARVLETMGIKDFDDTPVEDSQKPEGMGRITWDGYSQAQKKLIVTVEDQLKKEGPKIIDGQRVWSDERKNELSNEYIKNLLKDHGYDGIVYKNTVEGDLSDFQGNANSGDSYIALDPNQIKSAIGNNGEFSREKDSIVENKIFDTAPDPKEIEKLRKQVEDLENQFGAGGSSSESSAKKYSTLMNKLNRLEGRDIGEVHLLRGGSKVAYLSHDALKKLEGLFGGRSVPGGMVFNAPRLESLLFKLQMSSHPDWFKNSMAELLNKAKDDNGTVTVVTDNRRGILNWRLWILREELNHQWQATLGRNWQDHLPKEVMDSLHSALPKGLKQHLDNQGYKGKMWPSFMRVIEGAAKIMSAAPNRLGISPGEAHIFLDKYFKAVQDKYGEAAFDSLQHVTNQARRWKEEFLNANKPTDNTGTEPAEEPVGGLEAGASSGGSSGNGPPGPPKPPEPPEWDGDWRKLFEGGEGLTNPIPTEPWQDGPQHPALPSNLVERVNNAKAKNYTPDQISYIQSMLRAYAHGAQGLNPKELELYKQLRKDDDDNWSTAYNNGIIHSIVDNHIHHIWGEDPKKGYPSVQQAQSGAFAINASQARHRSWATAFEGILDGRQLAVHDPAAIIAHDADTAAQASAHRKALEILEKAGYKDPEGMPILTFRGMGRVVPGEDGTPGSILVNPNVVKNIQMTPEDIQRLTASGLLDTYLRDGRVVDRTPSVGQGNVKEWLLATQKRIQKLIETNPLLATPEERLRHEAGWGQLQLFAKTQAQKISEYLEGALQELKDGPIDAKGNFAPLPLTGKPNDLTMAKYLGDVLHGANNRITPADFVRLQEYAERNRNYAEGLNGKGEGPIRPHGVARLVDQEKNHLDPELSKYMDEIHDIFGKRDGEGNWSRKGLNTAIYHIAHAAENTEYPQLMRDLSDLKKVDNVFTSANPITQAQHKAEALALLKDINDRQPKQYLWAPKSHITIDHPSFHGYKWMASAGDGTPTLAESDMAVSRHYYNYIINRLGLKPSGLREGTGLGKVTAPLLKAGQQVKSTILSGSPFHVIQIALRALMLHVNPFVRPNPISDLDEEFTTPSGRTSSLRKGVENSLTLFSNKNAAEDYSVGVASHGGIVAKIPIYGPFTDQIHDLLFNRMIPSIKAGAYKKMYKQYAGAHPDWSDDAIAYQAAQHTNNAFGGVNWREMGRSATTQDWFNLVALAPDWLESEMRFAASLFNGYGIGPSKYQRNSGKNFTRIQVAQAAVVLWSAARLLNKLHSGNVHNETPFGLVVKDKDGRDVEYSVRTLPTDILHAATDPYGFLVGRTSPLARTGQELVTGRNQYGQKLTDSEKYVDMISNLAPIWGQSGFKSLTHLATASDVGFPEQIAKASGATAQVSRTPAQKTAANLASERSEEGSITPAQVMHHRILLQMEDNLRDGRIKIQDIQLLVDQRQLPEADAKNVIKNAKATVGLDPEQARMYSRVSRLDLQGAYAVYDDANPSEKAALHDLIVKKSKAYIRKSLTDETPLTRSQDPIFKRARRFAPIAEETP